MSYNEIQKLAQDVIKKYGNNSVPIDVLEIVKSLGIYVERATLPPNITGAIFISGEGNVSNTGHDQVIIVSNMCNKQKSRFIISHELGHLFCHYPFQKRNEDDTNDFWHKDYFAARDYDASEKESEKEADTFARCLLMPEDQVLSFLERLKRDGSLADGLPLYICVNEISAFFNVTKNKATDRIWDLCNQKYLMVDDGFVSLKINNS